MCVVGQWLKQPVKVSGCHLQKSEAFKLDRLAADETDDESCMNDIDPWMQFCKSPLAIAVIPH